MPHSQQQYCLQTPLPHSEAQRQHMNAATNEELRSTNARLLRLCFQCRRGALTLNIVFTYAHIHAYKQVNERNN